jgi:hypothetical protein
MSSIALFTFRYFVRVLVLFVIALSSAPALARLGESEAQSQARYGEPRPELIGADEKPLLEGAKELAYKFEDWRIRVAFLNNVAVRLQYIHMPDAGGLKKISDVEADSILEAEKGKFAWREQKARTGSKELNALATMFQGRRWERSDHAEAKLEGERVLTVQSREVDDYEKKLGRQSGKGSMRATPAPKVPKF